MRRQLLSLILLSLSLLGVFATVLPAVASADIAGASVEYIDFDHVKVKFPGSAPTGDIYQFAKIGNIQIAGRTESKILYYTPDGTGSSDAKVLGQSGYTNQITETTCVPQVAIAEANDDGQPDGGAQALLYLRDRSSSGNKLCKTRFQSNIPIAGKTNSTYMFNWENKDTLVPTGPLTFSQYHSGNLFSDLPQSKSWGAFGFQASTGHFDSSGSGDCVSYIDEVNANKDRARVHFYNDNGACENGANYPSSYEVILGDPNNKRNADVSPGDVSAGGGAGATTASQPQLECSAGINPLNWLLCGAVKGLNAIVGVMDNVITSTISAGSQDGTSDPTTLFGKNNSGDTDSSRAYYKAWAAIRTIAISLLVIVGLIVVITEALGFGFLDAYTIRKVLPRIFIAAILIALSWNLMHFFVLFTNELGNGVRSLIYGPFQNIGDNRINIGLKGGDSVAVGLAAGAAIATLGIFGLLSFVAAAALAVFTAFAVLVIRQIVIAALIIVAPLAILMYVLPNTNNLFKLWFNSFSRALLMFPIIAAFIASGRAFSAVANISGGTFAQFIAYGAYFAPYFLIPLTFKLAGGAMGAIGGAVNNRSKGGFAALAKFRGGQRKKRVGNAVHRAKTGEFVNGSRFVPGSQGAAARLNKRVAGVASGTKGHFGIGARGEGSEDLRMRGAARDALQNNKELQQLGFDDNAVAVMALSHGSASGARTAARMLQKEKGWTGDEYNRAVSTAESIGFNDVNTLAAVDLMAQNKSRVLSGSLGGQAGIDLVRQSVVTASRGNQQLVGNQMGSFAFHSRNAGRLDQGGESVGESMAQGWQRTSTQQHAQSFGSSMQAFSDSFVSDLGAKPISTDPEINAKNQANRQASAIALLEMQNMLPSATGENQGIINVALARAGVDHNMVRSQARLDKNNNPVLDASGSAIMDDVGVSVEEQLSKLAGGSISAADLRARARVYDSGTPLATRGGGAPPAGGGAPPATTKTGP